MPVTLQLHCFLLFTFTMFYFVYFLHCFILFTFTLFYFVYIYVVLLCLILCCFICLHLHCFIESTLTLFYFVYCFIVLLSFLYLFCLSWKGEEEQKPVFPKKPLNWEEDMELRSKYEDRKVGNALLLGQQVRWKASFDFISEFVFILKFYCRNSLWNWIPWVHLESFWVFLIPFVLSYAANR